MLKKNPHQFFTKIETYKRLNLMRLKKGDLMTWKTQLRKAPFNLGAEQEVGEQVQEQIKHRLLKELHALLVKYIDEPLKVQIHRNPQERAYTIKSDDFFIAINQLLSRGLKNNDIEIYLEDEYDVDDVMLDFSHKTITLEK